MMEHSHELREMVVRAERAIGRTGPGVVYTIDASQIKAFAAAIGDDSRLYSDQDFARRTRWAGIIAPPTFLTTLRAPLDLDDLSFGGIVLNGGTNYEWFRPIRAGMVVRATTSLRAVSGRSGRSGEMLILTSRTAIVDERNREPIAFADKIAIRKSSSTTQ